MTPECPECGASDQVEWMCPENSARQFGPGEIGWYGCSYCGVLFKAVAPEPPDDYEGDGVFAENH